MIPVLRQLSRHPNPHVCSKASLLLGRLHQNQNWVSYWVQGVLQDPDPRVRANAVESLWKVDSPKAREILLTALKDSHCRVVANALIGLYHLGDRGAAIQMRAMIRHSSAAFRAAAAFGIGETLDPQFLPALSSSMQDDDPGVRRNVFKAMMRIQKKSRSQSSPTEG